MGTEDVTRMCLLFPEDEGVTACTSIMQFSAGEAGAARAENALQVCLSHSFYRTYTAPVFFGKMEGYGESVFVHTSVAKIHYVSMQRREPAATRTSPSAFLRGSTASSMRKG